MIIMKTWPHKTIIAFVIVLNIFYLFYYFMRNNNDISKKVISANQQNKNELNIEEEFTKPDCNPINENYTQFRVEIDGYFYPRDPLNRFRNKSINFDCLNKSKKIKRIMLWNMLGNYNSYNVGFVKPFIENRCPVTNCMLTDDKSLLDKSDLVIVRMSDDYEKPKSKRPPNQKWVYVLYESPHHLKEIYTSTLRWKDLMWKWNEFEAANGFFNLTSTYRIDSDFPGHYETLGGMYWEENKEFNADFDFHQSKTHFAAAAISNCNSARSTRSKYINELKNFVQVDVFGLCGTGRCNGSCKKTIGDKYKFFLAFENSFCTYYMSEKPFEVLEYNIVPIVRGLGSFDQYVPKSGYIDANDFDSPRSLARYLKYLDSNKTAYNEFFKWKKYVKFDQGFRSTNTPICDMCIYLHLEDHFGVEKKIFNDIHSWTSIKENCHYPKSFKIYDEKLLY